MNFILSSTYSFGESFLDYNLADVKFCQTFSKQYYDRLHEKPARLDYNEQFLVSWKLKKIRKLAEMIGLVYMKTNNRAYVNFPKCAFGNIIEIKLCEPDKDKDIPFGTFTIKQSTIYNKDIELSDADCQIVCNHTRNKYLTLHDINLNKLETFLSETRMVYDRYEQIQEECRITSAAADLLGVLDADERMARNT